MLTIIHGDNISASRKYFLDEKEKYKEIQILDGGKITLTDLAQIFDGGELFSDNKTVFIEQFFTKRKKSKERDNLIDALQKYSKENNLFLWEGKELEKSVLNSFKAANIKLFKLPQTLFLFIDSIKPDNGKQLISLFHQTLETTDVEMIFFMMVRQVRLLLALMPSLREAERRSNPNKEIAALPTVARNDENKIDELKRLAPWQKTKLQQQANLFDQKQLLNLYKKLFLLEIGQKTGNLPNTILTSIDFLLLEI